MRPCDCPKTPLEWIPSNTCSAIELAPKAVVAGKEANNGSPLWLIRCFYQGDLVLGKLAIDDKAAYIPWGGKEIRVQEFEVCCAAPNTVKWVGGCNGSVPENAIPAGRTTCGEFLYIGRACEQGSLVPGKIHPSHKVCYMSYGGVEVKVSVYDVLCSV